MQLKITMILILLFSVIGLAADLTPKNVYLECVQQGIKYPEIVTAQSIQETGWYKCDNCSLKYNNIFGFWSDGTYIKFNRWEESVEYYRDWQVKYYTSGRDYYNFLMCLYTTKEGRCVRYAADPLYTVKVQAIADKYASTWK